MTIHPPQFARGSGPGRIRLPECELFGREEAFSDRKTGTELATEAEIAALQRYELT